MSGAPAGLFGPSRSAELGELLDEGQAALIVIGDWRLEERTDELLRHAERREARDMRALDRAETERQIAGLMSHQGA